MDVNIQFVDKLLYLLIRLTLGSYFSSFLAWQWTTLVFTLFKDEIPVHCNIRNELIRNLVIFFCDYVTYSSKVAGIKAVFIIVIFIIIIGLILTIIRQAKYLCQSCLILFMHLIHVLTPLHFSGFKERIEILLVLLGWCSNVLWKAWSTV